MKRIVLIGGGGHCKSIIDTLNGNQEYEIVGIVDPDLDVNSSINGVEVLGNDNELINIFNSDVKNAIISVGSIGDVKLRRKLVEMAQKIGFDIPSIVDRTSIIAESVEISDGVFIGKGVIVNSDSKIGAYSIINTGSIIEHDCHIGEYTHIAPGAVLSGGVRIGDNSHIGTNATVIQNIEIGNSTMIGAGSVVVSNVGDDVVAYGNPCNPKK